MVETDFGYLRENLADIRERIACSAERSGRRADDITLVAVSKTFSADSVKAAFGFGAADFGENYIQEAVEKIDSLKIEPRWHFIGHLQKNKVKFAIDRFHMVQSVDSVALLKRIDMIAGQQSRKMDVLFQVNVAGEDVKSGFAPSMLEEALVEAGNCENIRVKGLMLIPPFFENPEENRRNFSALRELLEKIEGVGYPNWEGRYLSMGMTDDFEVAIEEGSNMVRIGRAIFGPRRRK